MAVTITRNTKGPEMLGRRRIVTPRITFDNSYGGGYAITAREVGQGRTIEGARKIGGNAASGRYGIHWNTASLALEVFQESGARSYSPGGGDIKGSTNPAGTEGNADQAAAPVNSTLLLAANTFTNFAGTMTATGNPDVPRNVMITIINDSGGALDLFEGTTTFLITGTDKNGFAQTESVTLVSTAGNKSVADAKFRYVQGVKPFRTVTSVAITNAPAGGLKGSLGIGSRIGLPVALATPAHTDVTSLTINAARVASSATVTSAGGVDTTNNAVNAGTLADGADVGITYNDNGEVPVGADLSGVAMDIEFILL